METARKIDTLDVYVPAAPIRMPVPTTPSRARTAPSRRASQALPQIPLQAPALTPPKPRVVTDEEAAARAEQSTADAAVEFFCAQCRHAQFDRHRSLCLCTSPVAEFARQTLFAGQAACGWFAPRRRRAFRWSICSGRMF
jgi:hypothetical protein